MRRDVVELIRGRFDGTKAPIRENSVDVFRMIFFLQRLANRIARLASARQQVRACRGHGQGRQGRRDEKHFHLYNGASAFDQKDKQATSS